LKGTEGLLVKGEGQGEKKRFKKMTNQLEPEERNLDERVAVRC